MTFAEKLRELRDGAGLSEARLAEASGLSFSAVHQYGLGRRRPSFEAVVKLARALGVTCEAFAECVDVADKPNKKGRAKTMKPTATQLALFEEHFKSRTDKGLDFNVLDHIKQITIARRLGVGDRELAKAMEVPVNYVRALRATLA
jgi:transcriptional regulator with XRE-family HTH domain